jgi:HEAT repeat protein
VQALREFGPDARIAVPALVELLNADDDYMRTYATNALKAIDPVAAAKAGVK